MLSYKAICDKDKHKIAYDQVIDWIAEHYPDLLDTMKYKRVQPIGNPINYANDCALGADNFTKDSKQYLLEFYEFQSVVNNNYMTVVAAIAITSTFEAMEISPRFNVINANIHTILNGGTVQDIIICDNIWQYNVDEFGSIWEAI